MPLEQRNMDSQNPGYAVLVEKAGVRSFSRKSRAFSEKSRAFLEKALLFSDCQVLVVWRKSRAFSKKALLFPKLPSFLIIRGIPSMFWKSRACFSSVHQMEISSCWKPWIDIVFAASLVVCWCDQLVVIWLWCMCIVQLSLPYRSALQSFCTGPAVLLSLSYWPG